MEFFENCRRSQIIGQKCPLAEKRFGLQGSIALLDEHLHLALGCVQLLLASRRQAHALFEEPKRLFQGQVALFQLIDDGLQLFQRFFK